MDDQSKTRWTKKTIIKAIVTLVIIAFLIISLIVFVMKNNANAQIKQFSESINNNDSKTLATILSTNSRDMTSTEAEHLIKYLKEDDNSERLNNTLDEIKSNLKADKSTSKLGTLKDKNNDPIIDFSKNGKQFFVLDKISIKPHYREVYIKELDNTATYDFDKKHRVAVDKNKVSSLGDFVVGNYEVPVSKNFQDGSVHGKVNGKLHINTDDLQNGERIIAKQDFNQTKIKINLHNDEKLNSKNRRLLINGNIKPLKEEKTYGYFPNNNSFSVVAEGELNGQRFKTNKVDVLQGTKNNSTQIVNLYFNDKQINKSIKEDEKAKKKLNEFIKSYIDDLSKAYKNKDYGEISKYIKSDSKAEKFMKPKFKDKQSVKYKNVDVQNVEKDDETYKITVRKKYKSSDMSNIYHVKIENDEPKITDIDNI